MIRVIRNNRGFSVVEVLLVLVLIGMVVGIGGYVNSKRKASLSSTSSTSQPVSQATITPLSASQVGTTAGIDQLLQNEGSTEENTNKKYESYEQTNVTSSNAAAQNIGGAYNESSF